jgi:glycosyltransferase involved in cell wall biosynthesis
MGLFEVIATNQEVVAVIVFVNAISITEGGSLVVLLQLLKQLIRLRRDVAWHVAVCKRIPELDALDSRQVTTWVIRGNNRSPFRITYWYEWELPRMVRKVGADVLFSLTNYVPRRRITTPSLLLVQNAGHFSARFKELMEQKYPGFFARLFWRAKSRWVRQSVRRASLVTVQTHALARAVIEETGVADGRIIVVPHGTGLNRTGGPHKYPESGQWRIGYITNFGVQKNFLVLFRAIKMLTGRGHKIRLVLTLRQDTDEYKWVANDLLTAGIDSCVENYGDIPQDQVEALYDSLDLFVFPSLCESFGFPMVEAMARGLPMVVADVPTNREVTGTAAVVFDPNDHEALGECLEALMKNSEAYETAASRSLARATEFSWRAAGEDTMNLLERIALRNIVCSKAHT